MSTFVGDTRDRKEDLEYEKQMLVQEFVDTCKRQDAIKKRISEISMELYDIEFPDQQTEYVPPGEPDHDAI